MYCICSSNERLCEINDFYHLAMLANKIISETSNGIKRKDSNTCLFLF